MKMISLNDLRKKLEQTSPLTLLEALPARYFEAGHLPGALHMPHDQVAELAASLVPNKDAAIVVYCANQACQNSHIAAQRLTQLGYRDVSVFADGKQAWSDAGLELSVDMYESASFAEVA